ncbi:MULTISPECIES: LysM peptidoglycan-binding domain-containing protein [unclassified Luteococcus]|uniref:LysM peptidoglycan-binding domain-containing protein n=1 Tax=unclassified Luteococcus TaxID=2639923 RepID=UPI00313C181B
MTRFLKGIGSLLVLVGLVIAAPLALLRLGRFDALSGLSWDALLVVPDTGGLLLLLMTVVGWLAWLVVTGTVLAEVARVASRGRIRIRVPGGGWAQPTIAALVMAVASMAMLPAGPGVARAESAAPDRAAHSVGAPAAAGHPEAAPTEEPRAANAAPHDGPGGVGGGVERPGQPGPEKATQPATLYRVTTGDDLWSIAERFYGDGTQWRRIARDNRLDPAEILPVGLDLRLTGLAPQERTGAAPGHGTDQATGVQATARQAAPGPGAQSPSPSRPRTPAEVRVRPGDSLSELAERHLGDAGRWPEIVALNDQIQDPDLIHPGWTLRLPSRPGHPATPAAPAAPATPGAPATPAPPGDQTEPAPSDQGGVGGQGIPAGATARPPGSAGESPAGTSPSATNSPRTSPVQTSPAQASPAETSFAQSEPGETGARDDADASPAGASASPASEVPPETAAAPQPTGGAGADGQPMSGQAAQLPATGESEPGAELVVGLGSLLAAALAGALAVRRRSQLAQRRPGRRIPLPPPESLRFEAALGRSASRAPEPPAEAELTDVLLGTDPDGQPVLHQLEASGTTLLIGDRDVVDGAVAALTTGLVLQPWSAECRVTVVGELPWLASLDEPQVQVLPEPEAGLTHLERVVAARRVALGRAALAGLDDHPGLRRARQPVPDLAGLRADPDRWEAWAPHVFVFAHRLGPAEWQRVVRALAGSPVGISVLAAADEVLDCGEMVELPDAEHARVCSSGQPFTPHLMDASARRAVLELCQTTSSLATTPAPWWSPDDDLPPNLALLERRRTTPGPEQEEPVDPTAYPHPTLLLLGPLELHGCRGEQPNRARLQCIEYCTWIQLNPGRTASLMSRELMVAESTRRSNMSRLRNWLGTDPNGELYLPDAYSGRIQLHPAVTTDWEELQLLVARGVNRSSTDALVDALKLVRGAPLADAAPGQWLWAEEVRTDMASVVRDIGVVLAERALDDGDTELARWAANRALRACAGDELLMCARLRTEHLAGNQPEVERMVLQMTRQARNVGVDLDPETVDLMQEVMEGRRRSQLA